MNNKNTKSKKIDSLAFEDASLKLKIRENQMILDQIENNVDKNYFDFVSSLPLFDSLEKTSYEKSIINEIEIIGQKDLAKDPLANQKLVNEHIFYKQEQDKLKKQLKNMDLEQKHISNDE
ncbi:hypothetical protein M9Y10_035311 [Tritrichomonas musculus]|uniref:Uncharacterized protein n=1 Tax=Tritrichomonas musculus TaxID=1915356 RepID=A0ABR2KHC1_9EUKA